MQTSEKNRGTRKKAAVLILIAALLASALGGTFAWRDYNQHKTNELSSTFPKYDVTLLENFREKDNWKTSDGELTKQISVKNTGDQTDERFEEAYVRIQLKEYMELLPMLVEESQERYMLDISGNFVVFNTQEAALTAYPNHTVKELTDAISGTTGWFVQTEQRGDNGQYGKYVVTKYELGTKEFIVGDSTMETARKDAQKSTKHNKGSNAECTYPVHNWTKTDLSNVLAQPGAKEYIKWVLGKDVVLLSDWNDPTSKSYHTYGAFWIVDDSPANVKNPWIYWGEALLPGHETSKFLEAVGLIKQPGGDFYYSIHTEMEAISLDELFGSNPQWTDAPSEWKDSVRDNAPKVLLDFKDGQSQPTIKVGETLPPPGVTVEPAAGSQKVTWESSNAAASVDANGNLTGSAPGTATITATAENGKKAFYKVNVTDEKKSQDTADTIHPPDTAPDKLSGVAVFENLQAAVSTAKNANDYTSASWTSHDYDAALATVSSMVKAGDVHAPGRIASAISDLTAAESGLIPRANPTALIEARANAKTGLSQVDYTSASWSALENAIVNSNGTTEGDPLTAAPPWPDRSAAEQQTLIDNIAAAKASLLNISALLSAINNAEAKIIGFSTGSPAEADAAYMDNSAAFNSALSSARAAVSATSQSAVDCAVSALNTAAANLIRKPVVTGLTVDSVNKVVLKGSPESFTAAVKGDPTTPAPPQSVTWLIDGAPIAGVSINSSGVLTVTSSVTASSVTVRATSVYDNTQSGTKKVSIAQITPFTVSAAAASIQKGGTNDLFVDIGRTDAKPTTVTWSVEGYDADGTTAMALSSGTEITVVGGIATLNAASTETAKKLKVTATSDYDGTTRSVWVDVQQKLGGGKFKTVVYADANFNIIAGSWNAATKPADAKYALLVTAEPIRSTKGRYFLSDWSYMQANIDTWYNGSLGYENCPEDIKSAAVIPTGATGMVPGKSSDISAPTGTMAGASKKGVAFALSYKEIWDWGGYSIKNSSNSITAASHAWWSRSASNSFSPWSVTKSGAISFASDMGKNGVRPALWVKIA